MSPDKDRYRAWFFTKEREAKEKTTIKKDITVPRSSLTPSKDDDSVSEVYLSREELMKPIQIPK